MKQLSIACLLFLFLTTISFAQESKEEKQLEKWIEAEEYDKVIAYKAPKKAILTDYYYRSKAVAYIEKDDLDNALAQIDLAINAKSIERNYQLKAYIQYQREETKSALKTLDIGLGKDSMAFSLWYLKGLMLEEVRKYDEAKLCIRKCIFMKPEDADSRLALIDIYISEDSFDSANQMIQVIENDKRWDSEVKDELTNKKIRIFLLQKDFPKAKELLISFHEKHPNHAKTLEHLMQISNRENNLKEVLQWREKMYKSYNAKKLETSNSYFTFEKFEWKNYEVVAIEYYEQNDGTYLEVKHKFFFYDENNEVAFRIQSESSDAVRRSKAEYVLCKVDKSGYHTFWQYTFDKDPDYKALKEGVLKIAEGTIKPTAETIIGK